MLNMKNLLEGNKKNTLNTKYLVKSTVRCYKVFKINIINLKVL